MHFSVDEIDVYVNRYCIAPLEVEPADYPLEMITWKSSNPDLINVNDGVIVSNDVGTAVITASSGAKKCHLTVHSKELIITDFTVPFLIEIAPDAIFKYDITDFEPSFGTIDDLNIELSDGLDFVRNSPNGMLYIRCELKKGNNGLIKVSNLDGTVSKSTIVNCIVRNVTSISLNKTSLDLFLGEKASLTATINPANANNGFITWTIDNPEVISYDEENSMVEGLREGSATITATAGAYSASCKVNVKGSKIEGKSIMLTGSENAQQMSIDLKNCSWSSSDESIATVDQTGKVTGVSPGWVNIIATVSGSESFKEIRVVNKDFKPAFWTFAVSQPYKDPSGNSVKKLEDRVSSSVKVLPSYGSVTYYLGTDDGYTLSYSEFRALYGERGYYFKETRSGDNMADPIDYSLINIHNSYVKSSLSGSTISTVTGPNGMASSLTWVKKIGSISISDCNVPMSIGRTINIKSSFDITAPGYYQFFVNAGDSFLAKGNQNFGPSSKVNSMYGYTLSCDNSSIVFEEYKSSYECLKISDSTPKGTYKIYLKEYPDIYFNVVVK